MKEFIIKREEKGDLTIKLSEPNFPVLAKAWNVSEALSGNKLDLINSGKVLIDACCVEGLDELQKDDVAMISACVVVADKMLKIYSAELKKN